jgi:hypothetical protein
MRKIVLASCVVCSLVLLAMDPYSRGGTGGDVFGRHYAWQLVVAIMSALLLASALVSISRKAWRYTHGCLLIETAVFLMTNAIYAARDGWARLSTGFASGGELAVLVIGGAIVRLLGVSLASMLRSRVVRESTR